MYSKPKQKPDAPLTYGELKRLVFFVAQMDPGRLQDWTRNLDQGVVKRACQGMEDDGTTIFLAKQAKVKT
jgi:hypothetical protein